MCTERRYGRLQVDVALIGESRLFYPSKMALDFVCNSEKKG